MTLVLIGIMQAMPLVPAHMNCQEACCATPVSCCESEQGTGCDMAMTSCSVTLFVPLISAPLIKVDHTVDDDIAVSSATSGGSCHAENSHDLADVSALLEAHPPPYSPLLI